MALGGFFVTNCCYTRKIKSEIGASTRDLTLSRVDAFSCFCINLLFVSVDILSLIRIENYRLPHLASIVRSAVALSVFTPDARICLVS